MLEGLPDGIHSGLARQAARGVFFYYTASTARGEGRRHFWSYYDLHAGRVLDNRYLIAGHIACPPETPRVVGDVDIFDIQAKVMDHILAQVREQQAIEEAPKTIDPMQQVVATVLRSYMNHPDVDRSEVRGFIKRLSVPLPNVHVKALREAYQGFQRTSDLPALLAALRGIPSAEAAGASTPSGSASRPITKDDLHLICFDYVWS